MAEDTGAVSFNRMALGTAAVSQYFCSTPQLEVCKIRHRNESVNGGKELYSEIVKNKNKLRKQP
jgi:hypothetical protein